MPTASALLDQYVAQFDDTRANGLVYLNERYRRMVVEAQWFQKSEASLGSTVAGTSDYAVTAGIEDITSLRVGDTRYWPVNFEDFESLEDDENPGEADGPVFTQYYNSSGALYVRLHPEPETSGDAITVNSSGQPTALTDTTNAAGTPSIPDDLQQYLRDGLWADGYSYVRKRPDLAQPHDLKFDGGVQLLRRRRLSRIGSGASVLKVTAAGRG